MVELQRYEVEKTRRGEDIIRGNFKEVSFVGGLCRTHPTAPLARRDLIG